MTCSKHHRNEWEQGRNDTTTFLRTRKQIPFSCFVPSIPLAALTQFQVFVVLLCPGLRINYVVWWCSLLRRLKNSTSRSEETVKYVNFGQLHGFYIAVCLQISSLIWYHVIQTSIKRRAILQVYKSWIMTKTKIPESFFPINIQPRKYESFKNNHFANHKTYYQQDGIGSCSKIQDIDRQRFWKIYASTECNT